MKCIIVGRMYVLKYDYILWCMVVWKLEYGYRVLAYYMVIFGA